MPDEDGVSAKLHQDRDPWENERLHRKIIDAALSGARAMAAYQDVPLWTVCHFSPQVLSSQSSYQPKPGAFEQTTGHSDAHFVQHTSAVTVCLSAIHRDRVPTVARLISTDLR